MSLLQHLSFLWRLSISLIPIAMFVVLQTPTNDKKLRDIEQEQTDIYNHLMNKSYITPSLSTPTISTNSAPVYSSFHLPG